MISEATLARAVREGLITLEQVENLRALQAGDTTPTSMDTPIPTPDDESLRFVSGFGDVFVALGLILFFGAAGFFLQHFIGPVAMWVGQAALAWLLAEFFTRRRRMALPSIILLVVFVGSVFMSGLQTQIQGNQFEPNIVGVARGDVSGAPVWLSGLVAAGLAAVHYWRFRVPITVAAGAAAFSVALVSFLSSLISGPPAWVFRALVLVCGIGVFIAAMCFDSSDPERATRRTDIAFWLHLLAAPLIVHPVVSYFLKNGGGVETSGAAAILIVFLIFALAAIAIDRRAILVSGLTYAGIAFGSLLRQTGVSDMTIPATLLALGVFVLILSAGWQWLRRVVLLLFPAPIARRLPSPLRNPS
jgi:hypothetical protein